MTRNLWLEGKVKGRGRSGKREEGEGREKVARKLREKQKQSWQKGPMDFIKTGCFDNQI